MRRLTRIVYGVWALVLLAGFSLENPQVPVEDILAGGPSPEGIPAILAPEMVPVDEADHLVDGDKVVGLRVGNDIRAYPLKILNYHQVVNDHVGGLSLVVTYCPLSGATLVFDRSIAGQEVTFGASGLLYRSNVVLYDHQTRSLWSQLLRKAVAGPMAGRRLETHSAPLPVTWGQWKKRFPAANVMSMQTGFDRDYHTDPYEGYARIAKPWFTVGRIRRDLPAKTRVLGVASGAHAKAYPFDRLVGLLAGQGARLQDRLGDRQVDIVIDAPGDVTAVMAGNQKPLDYVGVYWFVWQAFYPHTRVAR